MILEVDTSSAVPPYEQIRDQVATMAAAGVLPTGSRLPPIRQLAADLGLANGTVARAYRELESEGVLESRGRHGSYIRGTPRPAADPGRLDRSARAFAVAARQLGSDDAQAVEAVRRALGTLSAG